MTNIDRQNNVGENGVRKVKLVLLQADLYFEHKFCFVRFKLTKFMTIVFVQEGIAHE